MIVRWRLTRHDLALSRPLTTNGDLTRTILLIEVEDKDGVTAFGEASPLPGLHPEDLDTVCQQINDWFEHQIQPPASIARFGVESAMLALTAARTGRRPAECIRDDPAEDVPLNALVSLTLPTIPPGFLAAKVKVGRRPLRWEIDALRTFQAQYPEVTLRLDANRAWDLDTAVSFAKQIADLNVEYFEEPLRDPHLLDAFFQKTGCGIGLDESLNEDRPFPDGARALIIKPTVVGGISAALQWIGRARQASLLPVISASFESGVGLGILAEIACTIGDGMPAQGLNTDAWFDEDVLNPPLRHHNGRLRWSGSSPSAHAVAPGSGRG
ncbi:MAG: o-succinylbenzoate synthase [Myxococcota bacterium]